MSSMREFFEREAGDYVDRIGRLLAESGGADVTELHRLAKGLRGSAQMAREGRVQEVAGALEAAARALSGSTLEWTPDVAHRLRDTVGDLVALIMADGTPDALEARVAAAVQRWQMLGVEPLFVGVGTAVPAGVTAAERSDEAQGWSDFFRFAAEETAAIAAELGSAVRMLEASPGNRRPLASIVRRQKALLGAADADRLGALGDVLRDVAEVARSSVSEEIAVAGPLIDYLRGALTVVQEAIPWLERGETPEALASLERLSKLRDAAGEPAPAGEPVEEPVLGLEEEFPVEVLNFFRSEAGLILHRLARIARELDSADAQERAPLQEDAHAALAALRDTALTFGFEDVAHLAAQAVELTSTGTSSLARATDDLRRFMVEQGVLEGADAMGLPMELAESAESGSVQTEAEEAEASRAALSEASEAEDPGPSRAEIPGALDVALTGPASTSSDAVQPAAQAASPEEANALEAPAWAAEPQPPRFEVEAEDMGAPAGADALADADRRRAGRVGVAAAQNVDHGSSVVGREAEQGPALESPAGAGGDVRPIEEFVYRGDSALRRALELRSALERLAAGRPEAQALVGELFELIELAQS
jgi:Hpt domain